jgi:DNA-binding GntR family transcriptional regulator
LVSVALKADIISGIRKPGERLRIGLLTEIYEVGATPLREALQRLTADGLVRSEGNKGFCVAPLDPAEFNDLNIARTCLETEAIRRSVLLGDDDWEARVVLAAWKSRKADAALLAGEITTATWGHTNYALHAATVSACGSQWLLRVRDTLYDQCERYRRAALSRTPINRDLVNEHANIADAVIQRNAELACELVSEHYASSVRHVYQATEEMGD